MGSAGVDSELTELGRKHAPCLAHFIRLQLAVLSDLPKSLRIPARELPLWPSTVASACAEKETGFSRRLDEPRCPAQRAPHVCLRQTLALYVFVVVVGATSNSAY